MRRLGVAANAQRISGQAVHRDDLVLFPLILVPIHGHNALAADGAHVRHHLVAENRSLAKWLARTGLVRGQLMPVHRLTILLTRTTPKTVMLTRNTLTAAMFDEASPAFPVRGGCGLGGLTEVMAVPHSMRPFTMWGKAQGTGVNVPTGVLTTAGGNERG